MKQLEVNAPVDRRGEPKVEVTCRDVCGDETDWVYLDPKEARDLAAELLTAANQIDWMHMRKVVGDATKTD
jgi:hypothetical protein